MSTQSRAIRLRVLLTGIQRYEKTVSTRGRGMGVFIDAPILAYLIETPNGRILYDVGCDYAKIADPAARSRYFDPMRPVIGIDTAPALATEDSLPSMRIAKRHSPAGAVAGTATSKR